MNFVEYDQTRRGGTLLPLITECRLDDVRHGFIEIGVFINDNGVLAAHLANDPFDVLLVGTRIVRCA